MINILASRGTAVALGLTGLVALAGCGSSSTSSSSSSSGNGAYTYPSVVASTAPSAAASSPASSGTVVVTTATATVAGKSETILTNTAGMTLYYRTTDTASSVCSGGCASIWPPLVLASGTPTSSATLNGSLAIDADANGNQVTYSGHSLYVYSGDSGPGSTKGEGVAGVWHAATPVIGAM